MYDCIVAYSGMRFIRRERRAAAIIAVETRAQADADSDVTWPVTAGRTFSPPLAVTPSGREVLSS